MKPKQSIVGLLIIFVVIIGLIVFAFAYKDSAKSNEHYVMSSTDNTDSLLKSLDSANAIKKANAKKVADSLKSHFNTTEDEFNKVTWYVHKSIMKKYWPNRKTIYSEVRNDGYRNIRSNYYAADWIFHTSIAVTSDNEVVSSEDVPTYNDENREENNGGAVWENITYGSSADNILRFIYRHNDKPVKVRFIGRQYHNDVILSKADVKALVESYMLAESLKQLQ